MKAISVWQPHATAIALQVKKIETRGWQTSHRGPIAIHAAKRWQSDQREFASEEFTLGRLPEQIPLGCIVAVVNLVDCKPTEDLAPMISGQERRWGNYLPGRFGWCFADVRALVEPVPFKGKQGFFFVPDHLLRVTDANT